MARDGSITLDFADGAYKFRLAWGQLAELQEKCDAGPYVIINRLHNGTWRIEDIREIVRIGLIGGGLSSPEALKLVRRYVEERPILENLQLAQVILSISLTGAPEEEAGEVEAASPAESQSTVSPTES